MMNSSTLTSMVGTAALSFLLGQLVSFVYKYQKQNEQQHDSAGPQVGTSAGAKKKQGAKKKSTPSNRELIQELAEIEENARRSQLTPEYFERGRALLEKKLADVKDERRALRKNTESFQKDQLEFDQKTDATASKPFNTSAGQNTTRTAPTAGAAAAGASSSSKSAGTDREKRHARGTTSAKKTKKSGTAIAKTAAAAAPTSAGNGTGAKKKQGAKKKSAAAAASSSSRCKYTQQLVEMRANDEDLVNREFLDKQVASRNRVLAKTNEDLRALREDTEAFQEDEIKFKQSDEATASKPFNTSAGQNTRRADPTAGAAAAGASSSSKKKSRAGSGNSSALEVQRHELQRVKSLVVGFLFSDEPDAVKILQLSEESMEMAVLAMQNKLATKIDEDVLYSDRMTSTIQDVVRDYKRAASTTTSEGD